MAKIKNVFIANDNTDHATEQGADAHDQYLAKAGNIEAYIQEVGLEKAQAGLMRKHLPQYLAFAASNADATAETPAEKAVVTKAAEKAAQALAKAQAKTEAQKKAEASVPAEEEATA